MDALGIFELTAKAGRAYVCAIRQAWAEAFAEAYKDRPADPQSDYYASRLGVAEEGGEALEPAEDRYTTASMHALIDARWCGEHGITWGFCKHKPHGITPVWIDPPAAPTPEPRMECDGPDAADAAWRLCMSYRPEAPNVACTKPAGHEGDHGWITGGYSWAAAAADAPPPVPSSSAGRGVGSPGVSAGAEEPAPPGGWPTAGEVTTADVVRQVLASTIVCGRGHLRIEDARTYDWSEDDWHDWRQAVAAQVSRRIDGGVGATPTPKPAKPTTFPCVVTGCPKRFNNFAELNTHSYWMHLEPDPFKTNEDPLVRYERYPGASPAGDFKWFSIKVTYPKSKAQK